MRKYWKDVTTKYQQNTKEGSKRIKWEENSDIKKVNSTKMSAASPSLSIIPLHVNVLNSPIKRGTVVDRKRIK